MAPPRTVGTAGRAVVVRYRVVVEGRPVDVEVDDDGAVWVDGRRCNVDLSKADGQPFHSLLIDNRSYETQLRDGDDDDYHVVVRGRTYRTTGRVPQPYRPDKGPRY